MYRLKITDIKSGKGTIHHIVAIPEEVYKRMGKPNEVIAEHAYDYLIIRPIKSIVISEASEEDVLSIRNEIQKVDTYNIPCTEILEHVKRMTCIHGSPLKILVNCIGTSKEHIAYILYLDGYTERILNGLSCGYNGTSPGALVSLVAWLSGRTRADAEIGKSVEAVVKARGARAIIVNNFPERIEVLAYKNRNDIERS